MTESRDLNKFLVRMPDGMRDRIAEEAKANNRSMNSEIVARLEASFPSARNALSATVDTNALITALIDEISELRAELKHQP